MANENEQQFQIEIRPEVGKGVYSNLVAITHSSAEVILDFVAMMPGMPKGELVSRIIMAPEHAKRLLGALNENLQKYERNFGTINLNRQPRPGSTIAPFNINPGEA